MLKTCTGRNKLHLASIKTCCQKKALLIGLFSYYLVHQYFGIDNIDLLRVNLFIVLIRRSSITKFFFWKKIQKKKTYNFKTCLNETVKKNRPENNKKVFRFSILLCRRFNIISLILNKTKARLSSVETLYTKQLKVRCSKWPGHNHLKTWLWNNYSILLLALDRLVNKCRWEVWWYYLEDSLINLQI